MKSSSETHEYLSFLFVSVQNIHVQSALSLSKVKEGSSVRLDPALQLVYALLLITEDKTQKLSPEKEPGLLFALSRDNFLSLD